DAGGDRRGLLHLRLLSEDEAPAAFGLRSAQPGSGGGIAIAAAIAMRNLIEAVLGRHRTYLHRLEQNVVAWVAHVTSFLSARALPVLPRLLISWRGHGKTTDFF